ncbi:MAG: alpha/beta hydrolase [Hydrogenophaga sp.]|uniref:alpha/beta fold hydrolase n=1 Tax=Hydrogenophaga sp. TaxID=1904254 RepID=UPI001D801B7B|nr:alpha/beta hydrolase [Hydrogenophaga sp.]MBX3609762.1 alpha/beta hydrolase [Hydrogenophaga sp.]
MTEPELKHLTVNGVAARTGAARQIAYWEWACADNLSRELVICVHGLSRQGRDFDTLARAIQPFARVIAVDVAGRGRSDWLAEPMHYQVPTYVGDAVALVQHLRAQSPLVRLSWVGTSMGGLIGMGVAAQAALEITRLVLNDVGPVIQWEALQRIATYVGNDPKFDTEQQALDYLASISVGFGPHTPAQWRELNGPMLKVNGGRYGLHYDPAIAQPFKAMVVGASQETLQRAALEGEAALWDLYDAIACPTLVLRGADSDLLSAATAEAMSRRGPRAKCVAFAGVGHAPTLMAGDQVQAVIDFLFKR